MFKVLKRPPEILIVGFEADEEKDVKGELKRFDYLVEASIDLSPFVDNSESPYDLQCVVAHEASCLGIRSEVIYTRSSSSQWLRIDA
jgi:hypothetical protein